MVGFESIATLDAGITDGTSGVAANARPEALRAVGAAWEALARNNLSEARLVELLRPHPDHCVEIATLCLEHQQLRQ